METQVQKVLITGAAGFVGHHMVIEACKAGLQVRATDRSSRFYGPLFEALGAEFIAADLTDPAAVVPLLTDIDAVFHVAGIHDYSTPDGLMRAVNVDAVSHLCEAMRNADVRRLVHFSSVAVYGYSAYRGRPVTEDGPKLTPPLNNYNQTKWQGEQIVRRHSDRGDLEVTVLRPGAVYGARAEYGLYNAFDRIYRDRNRSRLLIVGNGKRREAFLHVRDLCNAALYALKTPAMVGGTYNVADDSVVTTEEFFRFVSRELLGHEKPFIRAPLALLLPLATANQGAAKLLGMRPMLERATLQYLDCDAVWDSSRLKEAGFVYDYPTMERGVRETLSWYRENGWFPGLS